MKMNIKNILSVLFVSTLALSACSVDYDTKFTDKELEVPHSSQNLITFTKEGGEHEIAVNTNVGLDEWTAEGNAPKWLTVTKKADGTGVTVKAASYDGFKVRRARITIAHGNKSSYSIDVTQMGVESVLTVPEKQPFFNRDGLVYALLESNESTLEIPVETNLNVDHIIVPDTVDFVHLDTSKTVKENGTLKLHVTIDKNTKVDSRFCTITLQSSDNWDATTQCVLEQAGKGVKVRSVYPNDGNKNVDVKMVDLPYSYRVVFQRAAIDGNYKVTIPEDAKSWLSVKKDLTNGGEFVFSATQNTTDSPRTADLVCTPSNTTIQPFTIHVSQEAFRDINPAGVTGLKVTSGKGYFNVTWKHPEEVDYNKVRITAVSSMPGVPSVTKEVDNQATSATIDNVFKFAGAYTITVTTIGLRGKTSNSPVSQEATAGEWSELVPVTLTGDMVSTNSQKAGFEVALAVDGNTSTYFQTAATQTKGNVRRYIEITLENGITGLFNFTFDDHKAKAPEKDLTNRNPQKVIVSGSTDGVKYEKLGEITYRLENNVNMPLANCVAKKNYTHLRFEPTKLKRGTNVTNGASSSWWYLSELHLNIVHNEDWKKAQLGL